SNSPTICRRKTMLLSRFNPFGRSRSKRTDGSRSKCARRSSYRPAFDLLEERVLLSTAMPAAPSLLEQSGPLAAFLTAKAVPVQQAATNILAVTGPGVIQQSPPLRTNTPLVARPDNYQVAQGSLLQVNV